MLAYQIVISSSFKKTKANDIYLYGDKILTEILSVWQLIQCIFTFWLIIDHGIESLEVDFVYEGAKNSILFRMMLFKNENLGNVLVDDKSSLVTWGEVLCTLVTVGTNHTPGHQAYPG